MVARPIRDQFDDGGFSGGLGRLGAGYRDGTGQTDFATSQRNGPTSLSLPSTGLQPSKAEVQNAIERVTVGAAGIEILLTESSVAEGESRTLMSPWAPTPSRRRREIIQVVGTSSEPSRAMRAKARSYFTEAMRDARRWLDELLSNPHQTIDEIATREHKSTRLLRMTLSLAFLSPDLVKAAI